MKQNSKPKGGIYATSIPQNRQTSQSQKGENPRNTPEWRQRLHARGLSDSTIKHFGIKPHTAKRNQPGWDYPVHPGIKEKRWKNFDSQGKPKYRWLPRQSDQVKFYDPDGKLKDYIHKADGVLWLASGEPDVWALWEGGIKNVTCTFNGESKNIPDWYVPELRCLVVKTVCTAPDRDQAGLTFARKLRAALEGSGITLVIHELPFAMGSKGDINRYLQQVGREALHASLESLPAFDPGVPYSEPRPTAKSSGISNELYERWCIEVVEAAARSAWNIREPNQKGYSHKPMRCPFHDDQHPSAVWNHTTHGLYCHACGKEFSAKELAEVLGVPSWEEYKASQRGRRRGHNGHNPPSDEIVPAAHDPSPYAIEDGRMVYHKDNGADDGGELLPIADFAVTITEEIIDEGKQRVYRLEGQTIYGTRMDATISAQDFEDARLLKAALAAVSDPRAAIYPGMERHLAPAIHKLTTQTRQIRRYNRTGWADGSFLMPGSEPEGVVIALNRKLPYSINQNASREKGLSALDYLIRAVGPENSLPVLTTLFQAPMAHLADWRNERYAVFIQGRTGMFKTSWTQTAMSIYGPDFAYRDDLLIKMGEGATLKAIMAYAAYAYDLPLLIDNFKPNTGGGKKDFVNLIHNILEGGDRDRLDRNSELKDTKSVFAWPIFTGEDIPEDDPASLARVLLVRFEAQPDNAGELLSVAQADAGHLSAVGYTWLNFLEGTGKQQVTQALKAFDAVRQDYLKQLGSIRKDAVNVRRIATNLATNHLTWSVLCAHPHLGPVFQPYDSQYRAGIQRITGTMAGATAESLAATHYLTVLRQLLVSSRYVIANLDGSGCNLDTDRDRLLGYHASAPKDGVYLLPDVTRTAVERLIGPDALGGISATALYKQLDDLGYIASKDKNGTLKTARVGREQKATKVLHLRVEALSEDE
jgi:hypothetical protein